ncbi:hypothetical protein PMAG_a1302 [Pseudoalteromonas mariniglutinosa NCIMB 1770]|nr:hypothetical protein [Pseudoalteromonas mariniglutinosa NCIMB 1770]
MVAAGVTGEHWNHTEQTREYANRKYSRMKKSQLQLITHVTAGYEMFYA